MGKAAMLQSFQTPSKVDDALAAQSAAVPAEHHTRGSRGHRAVA
jgi:hypothetical protein